MGLLNQSSVASGAAQSGNQGIFSPSPVIPLAMPLLVGPGVIANVILYANEVEQRKNDLQLIELAVVCIFISVLVCAILLSGRWLQKVLGNIDLSIATRILGLLVASIGVQFIVVGVTNIIVQTIAPQLR